MNAATEGRTWVRLTSRPGGDVEEAIAKPTPSGLAEVRGTTLDDGTFVSLNLVAHLTEAEADTLGEVLLDFGTPRLDQREPTCRGVDQVDHAHEPRCLRWATGLAAAYLQQQVRQMLIDGVGKSRLERGRNLTDEQVAVNKRRHLARKALATAAQEDEPTSRLATMLLLPILDGSPVPSLEEMAERLNRDLDETRALLRRAQGIVTRVGYAVAAMSED